MAPHFGYPDFSPEGVQLITTQGGTYREAMMDITVYRMKAGETRRFDLPEDELALLLMEGAAEFAWAGRAERAERPQLFDEGAGTCCLHVCRGVPVTVTALANSEILAQATANAGRFEPVFYRPADIRNDIFCKDLAGGNSVRRVTTIFDYANAPYSNMVLGEVFGRQGSWSSYPPHGHPQPEVYYYRTDKPQGFGACFVGDEVYKIKDRSFSCLTGGLDHPQVSAPGYRIYVAWMIRHLPGNPWTTRDDVPEHTWIYDAKF